MGRPLAQVLAALVGAVGVAEEAQTLWALETIAALDMDMDGARAGCRTAADLMALAALAAATLARPVLDHQVP